MNRPKRILLTGFGPFPGVEENATSKLVPEIAERAQRLIRDVDFAFEVLPVSWRDGPGKARRLIEQFNPAVVLHFGVSEAASGFVIETRAATACRTAADAVGELPPSDFLGGHGEAGKASTIPYTAVVSRLRSCGLPAELSDDAGGYLCNAVLFDTLSRAQPGLRAGFIHVPTTLTSKSQPMTAADAVRGGLEIIRACVEDDLDSDNAQRANSSTRAKPPEGRS